MKTKKIEKIIQKRAREAAKYFYGEAITLFGKVRLDKLNKK